MKHLPDLFETWNRKRGTDNAAGAYAIFIGCFAILYALVYPWVSPPKLSLSPWVHYSVVVGLFAVAIAIIFQWFWYSDR